MIDSEQRPIRETSEVEDAFLRRHRPPEHLREASTEKLPLPVVSLQRGPRIVPMASSEHLHSCLKTTESIKPHGLPSLTLPSSAANPWLSAINLASTGMKSVALCCRLSQRLSTSTLLRLVSYHSCTTIGAAR